MGQLQAFMDALVGLESGIDPKITVERWRPVNVDPPTLYNWILPSPSSVPAVGVVLDMRQIAVRVVAPTGDIGDEEASAEQFFDAVMDVLDADLIFPHKSVLRGLAHETRRTTSRTFTDWFNAVPFLALEIVIQAEFRRYFTPS